MKHAPNLTLCKWLQLKGITFGLGVFNFVVRFVYLFAVWDGTWFQEWEYLRTYEPYFVGSYESQVLFALMVLLVSMILHELFCEGVMKSSAANTRLLEMLRSRAAQAQR